MKVSVLMTIYNDGGRLLTESISNILNQTYSNLELVIVDDGSIDNSKNIIQRFAESDSRIKFINREKNKGRVYSLNEGLKKCSSELIFINDADDISDIYRIEKCLDFYTNKVSNKKKFGILGTAYLIHDINKSIKTDCKIKRWSFSKTKLKYWRLLIGMPFPHSSFMYSKRALDDIGGFPTEVTSSIDYFTILKIANSYDVYGLDSRLVERTIDNKNHFMTKEMTEKNEVNMRIIQKWLKKNIKYYYIISIPSKVRLFIKSVI